MIRVSPRARRNRDDAGDPLDGLVNLFDVGIVLAVAFLLAALSSLGLTAQLTQNGLRATTSQTITVPTDGQTGSVPSTGSTVIGEGSKVGSVYRLSDGRLVYVTGDDPTPAP